MLELIPMTLAQANDFVAQHHRHHGRVQGHKFSIGCMSGDQLAGVVIAGRPNVGKSSLLNALEVTRLCTLGGRNVCSFLYAAAARAAKAMGYRKIITYTLDTETGASIRAAGWYCAGLAGGTHWTGQRRRQPPTSPEQMKYRYEKIL